MSFVWQKV